MKKLLDLKKLEKEVKELLHTVEKPLGIYLCAHIHYNKPTISIYYNTNRPSRVLGQNGIVYHIEDKIDEQTVDEIISKIEKVLQ